MSPTRSQPSSPVGRRSSARPSRPEHSPVTCRDGVLTVDVDDGGWATQLRYSETDVIARFAAVGVAIARVRVAVGASG